jgi:hypothetical protein
MLAALALAAQVSAAPAGADALSWAAGYWLSCDGSREVSETWSDPRGGVMSNMTLTLEAGRAGVERAQFSVVDGALSFTFEPSSANPVVFRGVTVEAQRVVFENPANEFPQRVTYWRDGSSLRARIEQVTPDDARAMEWTYDPAPLNARCPA